MRRGAWAIALVALVIWAWAWRQRRSVETRWRDAQRGLAALVPPPAARPPRQTPGAPPQVAAAPSVADSEILPETDAFFSDPKLRQSFLTLRRAAIDLVYGPCFRKLGLTAVQVDRLEGILADEEQALLQCSAKDDAAELEWQKFWSGGAPQPDFFSPYRLAAIVAEAAKAGQEGGLAPVLAAGDATLKAAVMEVAGNDGWAAVEAFQRDVGWQPRVVALAGALATSAEPLTPAQADALTTVLAKDNPVPHAYNISIPWTTVLGHAQAILSPAQMAVFKNQNASSIAQQDYLRQLGELLRPYLR